MPDIRTPGAFTGPGAPSGSEPALDLSDDGLARRIVAKRQKAEKAAEPDPFENGLMRDEKGKVKLSPEASAAFLGSKAGRKLDYTVGPERKSEPTRTREEILAEAKARDPESWKRATKIRESQHRQLAEDATNKAELHALRLDRAINALADAEDESEYASAMNVYKRTLVDFGRAAPVALQTYLEQLDEEVYAAADADGIDVDDPGYPSEDQLPSNVIGPAVLGMIREEDARSKLAHSNSMIEKLTEHNVQTFLSLLDEAGLKPDTSDEQSPSWQEFRAIEDWVESCAAVRIGELALQDAEEAARLYKSGIEQLNAWESNARISAAKKQIMSAETTDVSGGLRSAADEDKSMTRELIDEVRALRGLPPKDVPDLPTFDPSWVKPQTREETADQLTVGEFKRSVVEGEGMDASDAWTVGDEPVSRAEAQRNHAAEERTALEQRVRLAELNIPLERRS